MPKRPIADTRAVRKITSRSPLWKRPVRRAAKRLLAWRYRHFTPDSEPDKTTSVAGLRLQIFRGVFDPAMHFSSGVLASYVMSSHVAGLRAEVLDLGTGSGVVAIAAGIAGAGLVVAIDINPQAVKCARLNVKAHHLEHVVKVREGDMFEPVQAERFDLVLCNPPYFRGEPVTMADRAFHAGSSLDWLRQFGEGLHGHLKPSGSAIISLGDAADIASILALLKNCGWSCAQVARRDILVETIYLFRLTRRG